MLLNHRHILQHVIKTCRNSLMKQWKMIDLISMSVLSEYLYSFKQIDILSSPWVRLNIKMLSYQYRHSHVKDKTVLLTVLSLTWEYSHLGKKVFILRQSPGYVHSTAMVLIACTHPYWHLSAKMSFKISRINQIIENYFTYTPKSTHKFDGWQLWNIKCIILLLVWVRWA